MISNFTNAIHLIFYSLEIQRRLYCIYKIIFLYIYIYIRGGTIHVFGPNSHGTGVSVRCMRPYNEYRQFTPIQKLAPAVMQRCLITSSRRTANAELRTWKQSPLDSDHVLILNTSLTDKGVYFKGLHTQLFAKWSFVLLYPTSLIRHESKYSVIFPYLQCNIYECETIIY